MLSLGGYLWAGGSHNKFHKFLSAAASSTQGRKYTINLSLYRNRIYCCRPFNCYHMLFKSSGREAIFSELNLTRSRVGSRGSTPAWQFLWLSCFGIFYTLVMICAHWVLNGRLFSQCLLISKALLHEWQTERHNSCEQVRSLLWRPALIGFMGMARS